MNRIYAALATLSLLASAPAFAKTSKHVAKAPVADKAAAGDKAEVKADSAEAKPAEGEKAKPKKTKKTTKKTEETKKEAAPEAAPAK